MHRDAEDFTDNSEEEVENLGVLTRAMSKSQVKREPDAVQVQSEAQVKVQSEARDPTPEVQDEETSDQDVPRPIKASSTLGNLTKRKTSAERTRAEEARQLHCVAGHPSDAVLKDMLKHGKFRGCTLSPADVDTAAELLGKSRLVAGGHRQHEATFSTTSSPTVDISSVFLSLGLSTYLPKCTIHNTDIPAAYLHCFLKDNIFMRLPKSLAGILVKYNVHLKEYLANNGSIVVKLLRSLYRLKQSSAKNGTRKYARL